MRTTSELRASTTFRGVRVSVAHAIVLEAAGRDRIYPQVNSGRRTRSEQEQLVREKGVYDPVRNPHGAARYSPRAPHIKAVLAGGKQAANHALDVDVFRGSGPRRLAAFYARHGCPLSFNVPTEAWHVDPVDEAKLLAAARRLDDPLREYPADERRWIREYDDLGRRKARSEAGAAKIADRRHVLRRAMLAKRKSIWRAAQESGWDKLNRRARYKSLLARTT